MHIYEDEVLEEYEIGDEPVEETLDRPEAEFTHHKGPVYAIANHPTDACLFMSGGGDDLAFIFDQNGVRHTLAGHTDSVIAVGFNFDGSLAASVAV